MGGDRFWLHCVSNDFWTLYYPHEKRGMEAINEMGVLPGFKGILCHDHWKPYYKLDCTHALCNAHHLRELTRAWEQDGQQWAQKLKNLLEKINARVIDAGGAFNAHEAQKYRLNTEQLFKKVKSNARSRPGPIKRAKGAGSKNQNPAICWNG